MFCELRLQGVPLRKCVELTGLSMHTYYRVKKKQSWKDYEAHLLAEREKRARAKVALDEEIDKSNTPQAALNKLLPLAFAVFEEALTEPTLPMRLRLDAAKEVLDRTGLGKSQKISVTKELTLPPSLKALAEQVKKRLPELQKKLPSAAEVQTVEGEIVESEEKPGG